MAFSRTLSTEVEIYRNIPENFAHKHKDPIPGDSFIVFNILLTEAVPQPDTD